MDFAARLFSRQRPSTLTAQSSVEDIFKAINSSPTSQDIYDENLKAVEDLLLNTHHFPLSSGDREGIAWALSNYHRFGPSISYNSSLSASAAPAIVGASTFGGRGGNNFVTYATLMLADDGQGLNRSFLATDENFAYLKDLESRNMVVPIDLLDPILDDMIKLGRPNRPARPWLGMYAAEAGGQILVGGLAKDGPAHRAGIRQGDMVLEVAGRRASSLADLFRRIWALGAAGAQIPLTLAREGSLLNVLLQSVDRNDLLKKPLLH